MTNFGPCPPCPPRANASCEERIAYLRDVSVYRIDRIERAHAFNLRVTTFCSLGAGFALGVIACLVGGQ